MPSATAVGAVVGLVYQMHSNALRNRQPWKHAVSMALGAVLANMTVEWDAKAKQAQAKKANDRPSMTSP
ncbi:hypothetical protein PHJA_000648700 [Phtheirospermum japonicum]|uniref:Uncharacterized protein n=1 Tax=Phtheirospermum japonicum TaxID=374723 RepID=A0A830BI09_9LAMI|nr:hypothetical protein PHJA_000648700 [Phtheirospermum japonicum]